MLIVFGLVVLAIVLLFALQIDDWSRDLTTNRAATSANATDPTLRSLVLQAPPEQVKQAITRFAVADNAWTLTKVKSDSMTETSIALVRNTRWLRFADDVQVFLQATDDGTRVDIASQSRIGKGDLGQNPRNIRELLQALREELE